jgi:hypothetical protein
MASKNSRVGKERFPQDPNVLSKYNHGNGAGWCTKRDAKRANRAKGHTPGISKGLSCQANTMQRYMAKTGRSYKHPSYGTWLEWCRNQR